MGRHSAQRRHGPVVVLGAAAVVGSAGIAWAVGGGTDGGVPSPKPASGSSPPARSTAVGVAPTPSRTTTGGPVVRVVPAPTPADTAAGVTAGTTAPSTAAPPPDLGRTATPQPTRTHPGRGGPPTPRPTKTHP